MTPCWRILALSQSMLRGLDVCVQPSDRLWHSACLAQIRVAAMPEVFPGPARYHLLPSHTPPGRVFVIILPPYLTLPRAHL